MGRECVCSARFAWIEEGAPREGKALLEEDMLLFRGEPRVKLLREEIRGMTVLGESLVVACGKGKAHFELGAKEAAKWRDRFLSPKSLLDKFGVKPEQVVSFLGPLSPHVVSSAADAGAKVAKSFTAKTEVVLAAATSPAELVKVARVADKLTGTQRLWILYPKGDRAFPESVVRQALLATGLVDTKTARVDDVWTSLQFVVRKENR